MSPAASSRWCPTPEQLMILEEMYRGGIRTPNASQIQQITAHLSLYGRIEGKNVFYWFQNHKARDRQKLRRKLTKQLHQQQLQFCHHHHQPQTTTAALQNHQHHLLGYLESPPASAHLPHHQVSHFNPIGFLPQGGVDHTSTPRMMSYLWKPDHDVPGADRIEVDKFMPRTYGRDWMMMMMLNVGQTTSPPCTTTTDAAAATNKPLKTLELFPISATALKDECTSTNYY
ncbi:hypothetical protein NMG60_11014668 [Bertholletia excelsa]